MFILGAVGVLLSLACYRVAFRRPDFGNARLFLALFALHIFACLLYWRYSLNNPADSNLYFNAGGARGRLGWAPGTAAVINAVQWLKARVGGAYLDYFLLFQATGMLGLAFLVRTWEEVARDLGQPLPPAALALLFLPGLHFWTSAVGKDGPLFLACALAVWSALRVERRAPALLLALALMGAVRPHVAAIAAVSLLAALLFDRRLGLAAKLPVLLLVVAALSFILGGMERLFGLDPTNVDAVGEFISTKQEYGLRREGNVQELAYPLRVLSLLFRPFFFDASGALGLIVSVENAILLVVVGALALRSPTLLRLAASVAYVRFCLVFALLLVGLLAAVSYNIGLGLRQKFMAMPALLTLFVTLLAYRRARTQAGSMLHAAT